MGSVNEYLERLANIKPAIIYSSSICEQLWFVIGLQ